MSKDFKHTQQVGENEFHWNKHVLKNGMTALEMQDPRTEFTLVTRLARDDIRTEAIDAWSMTSHSRNPGTPLEIITHIADYGVDADEKMGEIFRGYGHASVADMAQIAIDFDKVPMHLPLAVFNICELNSGQEKSTRYIGKFTENSFQPLEHYVPGISQDVKKQFADLGQLSLQNFNQSLELITEELSEYFKPETKRQKGALNSRALDTARSHYLVGLTTGAGIKTNARDWARIVGSLKASPQIPYRHLGEQIDAFLAPERVFEDEIGAKLHAPELIRYTKANSTVSNNFQALREYLDTREDFTKIRNKKDGFREYYPEVESIDPKHSSAQRMVANYMLDIYPTLNGFEALDWLDKQDHETKAKLGEIIYKNHTHHQVLPQNARTSDIGARIRGSVAEVRDWNRHRAWSRIIPQIPLINGLSMDYQTAKDILEEGFVLTSYIVENPEFKKSKELVVSGLMNQYEKAHELVDTIHKERGDDVNYGFISNILPFAHKTDIWMSGDSRQAHYMTKLRVRPGGHINYRKQAYELSEKISEQSAYLQAGEIGEEERPDAFSRTQFFDRS